MWHALEKSFSLKWGSCLREHILQIQECGTQMCQNRVLDHTVANASHSCHLSIHLLTQKVPPFNQPRENNAWKVTPRFPSLPGNRFCLKSHPDKRNIPGAFFTPHEFLCLEKERWFLLEIVRFAVEQIASKSKRVRILTQIIFG